MIKTKTNKINEIQSLIEKTEQAHTLNPGNCQRIVKFRLTPSEKISFAYDFYNITGNISLLNILNDIPKESPFYGAIIDENLQKEIKEVTQYIKNEEKDVIVLSSYAPFYSIILNDLENKECDWALRGNLGIEGEAGFTEKIKELDNTQILLYDNEDEEEIYQFVFDTIEYIKQNMKYIGKIQNFSIYETID